MRADHDKTPIFLPEETTLELDRELENIVINGSSKDALSGAWVLKNKYGWELESRVDDNGGAVLEVIEANLGTSLYARTVIELDVSSHRTLRVDASLDLEGANSCQLTATLYQDELLTMALGSVSQTLPLACRTTLKQELPISGRLYLLLQIDFPAKPHIARHFNIAAKLEETGLTFEPKSFNIHCFGTYKQASSRLRGWKLAEALEGAGHEATVNELHQADVYIFQKVRPFSLLTQIKNRENRILAFDFDDNYFLDDRGDSSEFISFINQMDVVMVGSEYLRVLAERFHPNVVLVDNPADVDSTDICKVPSGWNYKVGWFGAPENVSRLESVDYAGPVTTVTRGGDIEYDQDTIDQTLVDFDLLLFPQQIDQWSAAKNANRLVKAVALGIPVLASVTPEHERAAAKIGLPDKYLIREGESWSSKISAIRDDYERVSTEFLGLRERTLVAYDSKEIARQVFETVFTVGKRSGSCVSVTNTKLCSVDLMVNSLLNEKHDFDDFAERSDIRLDQFARTILFDKRITSNQIHSYGAKVHVIRESNPLAMYERMDDEIANSNAEYFLIANDSVVLMRPFLEALSFEHDVLGFDTTSFGASKSIIPRQSLEAYRVLKERIAPELLLVKTDWLRKSGIKAAEMLSWFPLAIWEEALVSNATNYAFSNFPVGLRRHTHEPVNVSHQFAKFCIERDAAMKSNLPNCVNQWARLSHDIVHTILERNPEFSSAVAARLLQGHYAELAKS